MNKVAANRQRHKGAYGLIVGRSQDDASTWLAETKQFARGKSRVFQMLNYLTAFSTTPVPNN
jgi:hypothetical protein